MREVLNRLVALLALVSFLVIAAAIAFSGKAGLVFDRTFSGIGTALFMIGQGFIILFCTALGLGIAYGVVKIWQATRVHVIRDGKDGQIARSIVYKGEVVQMMSTMFDAVQQGDMQIKQLEYFEKAFKMMLQATKTADKLWEDEEDEDEPLQIEAPKMYPLSEQLRSGQTQENEDTSVIGYMESEPMRGRLFDDDNNIFDSVFIIGDQGFGKSAFAAYLAALTIHHHGYIIVIDPDADLKQSLANRLGPLANEIFLLCPIADTPEKAERALDIAEDELESPGDYPVLFLIDELSMIMRQSASGMGKWCEIGKRLALIAENWATRGRKRRRRVAAFGQIPNSKRSGGTEFRDSCTVVSFHLKKKRAQMVLEEEAEIAPDLGMGEVIVIPARSSEASYRMQLPYPDNDGLRMIAETMAKKASGESSSPFLDDLESIPDEGQKLTGKVLEILPEMAFKAKVRRVRELRKQGKTQSQIIEMIWGVKPGGSAKYASASDEYQSIINQIELEDAQAEGGR